MKKRILNSLGSLFGLLLFAIALWALHHELRHHQYQQVVREIGAIPLAHILLAFVLTVLDYAVLTGYDTLAFRYIGQPLELGKIRLASFIGYAFSHNLGFSLVSGGSVRYRLYSSWGLSAIQVTKLVAFCGVTFWLGFLALGGSAFLLEPPTIPGGLHLPFDSVRAAGTLFLALAVAYLAWSFLQKRPLRVFGWEFSLPRPRLAFAQLAVATADWALAAAVLYALLPAGSAWSYPDFLGIFLLAQIIGMVSQVPGGLGIFETVMLLFLSPALPSASVIGSLLVFRGLYYLLPLVIAAALLGGLELLQRREDIKRVGRLVGQWLPVLTPHVIAFTVFVGGAIMLFSGATPADHWQIQWLRRLEPLPLLEISHFTSSVIGACLLILARGLQRRLDAAYHLTVMLLGIGVVVSLLKGFDYAEAATLAVMFSVLLPTRRHFHRKASLISERFSAGWVAAIVLVLAASIWLGMFSYKHVEYRADLWWRFAFSGNAPRFLRASVGALGVALVFGITRLMRPAPAEPQLPGPIELGNAREIVRHSRHAAANLALLGDKHLLFSESGDALLMYGVLGRTWVAMGDPVGPREEWEELVWQFRGIVDGHDGWTAFYQVQPDSLPLYLDLGLTLLKLGEEARVDLSRFSLEGGVGKGKRNLVNRLEKEGCEFAVVPVGEVPLLLGRFREISDTWLDLKSAREKRFSLGFFDDAYLRNFPAAVVRRGGIIVAFANVWTGANKEEISVDLMRHLPDAPDSVMEYLFIRLMLWAKAEGFGWFNLGMAPLAGLEDHTLAPLWTRLGAMVFRHGEHFYNFQGLRQYKAKFDPVWTPRYLASPGGIALPRILTSIATLISGGLKGVIVK
ncbi:MAG: bifunctional lysylphosphatidylglycerol flippase/synthetase MprF [Gammaproteobacteria bacterium]|nr:bifunctional lysylphosphatidylglycerol flippase/synthetase MprF [Gammaproteobacteria bacterium]